MLKIGSKVKFLHTPEQGVVREILSDGMVLVWVKEFDMDIPVDASDLFEPGATMTPEERAAEMKKMMGDMNFDKNEGAPKTRNRADQSANQKMNPENEDKWAVVLGHKKVDAKEVFPKNENFLSSSKKPSAPPPKYIPPTIPKVPVTNTGFWLCFEGQELADGSVEKYTTTLLNDTSSDLVYDCSMLFGDSVAHNHNGKLVAGAYAQSGALLWSELSDLPTFELDLQVYATDGISDQFYKTIRIKPQQFFKMHKYCPPLQKDLNLYQVFERWEHASDSSQLRNYTDSLLKGKQEVKKKLEKEKEVTHWYDPIANVSEFANFDKELDLHIEMLVENPAKLTSTEMIQTQLRVFETYLSSAIRLHIPKVYIIHGVGTGRLKDSIAARLRRNENVKSFKTDYHPKYGWGATEVII
jgi:hypothetical protein